MILLLVGIISNRGIGNGWKIIRPFLRAFAVPLLIYAEWKLWYFGNLLPNSFYVKVSQVHAPGISGLFPGRGAVRIFFEGIWYLLPFSIVAAWKRWKSDVVQITVLWCMMLSVFYCFSVLIQNEYQRFTYPIEVMLIVLSGIGYQAIARERPGIESRMRAMVGVLLVVVQVTWVLFQRRGLGYIERMDEATSSYPYLAEVFRSIPDHEAITLAWGDAGRLPYFSGMRSIDPVGLNTNAIAHARTAEEVVRDVIQAKPDLLIIPLVYPRDVPPDWNPSHDAARMILPHGQGLIGSAYPALARAALAGTYKPIVMTPQPIYDLDLLADTTSPHYRDIVNTIAPRIGRDPNFLPPATNVK
jgi:hypothetical protein